MARLDCGLPWDRIKPLMMIDHDRLRRWGSDAVGKRMNEAVEKMPDRPRVVIVLIFYGRDHDEANAEALKPIASHQFTTDAVVWLGVPARITYFGFDASDSALFDFWIIAASLPRLDELVVYIDGVPKFRADTVLPVETPPQGPPDAS